MGLPQQEAIAQQIILERIESLTNFCATPNCAEMRLRLDSCRGICATCYLERCAFFALLVYASVRTALRLHPRGPAGTSTAFTRKTQRPGWKRKILSLR